MDKPLFNYKAQGNLFSCESTLLSTRALGTTNLKPQFTTAELVSMNNTDLNDCYLHPKVTCTFVLLIFNSSGLSRSLYLSKIGSVSCSTRRHSTMLYLQVFFLFRRLGGGSAIATLFEKKQSQCSSSAGCDHRTPFQKGYGAHQK